MTLLSPTRLRMSVNRPLDKRSHRPIASDAADIEKEIVQDRAPLLGMDNFRMKLQAVDRCRGILHCRDRDILGRSRSNEPARKHADRIAMTHPDG